MEWGNVITPKCCRGKGCINMVIANELDDFPLCEDCNNHGI